MLKGGWSRWLHLKNIYTTPLSAAVIVPVSCMRLIRTCITYLKVGAISIDRSQEIPERAHN